MHIRDAIAAAKAQEAATHQLETLLETKLTSLHKMIALPKERPANALLGFITRYVEHVPDLIEALSELSQDAGIYDATRKFLVVAENYFRIPPETVTEQHDGLQALIDEAYLAHRLLEEVNDRMMMLAGAPFIPMDMTRANLVIHNILGESFANKLDETVHYSIDALFRAAEFTSNQRFLDFIRHNQGKNWADHVQKWPCLAGDSSINIAMPEAGN